MVFVGLPLSCPDHNHNTQDREGEEWRLGVGSWAECSALCRERAGCRYWTWHHKDAGEVSTPASVINNKT